MSTVPDETSTPKTWEEDPQCETGASSTMSSYVAVPTPESRGKEQPQETSSCQESDGNNGDDHDQDHTKRKSIAVPSCSSSMSSWSHIVNMPSNNNMDESSIQSQPQEGMVLSLPAAGTNKNSESVPPSLQNCELISLVAGEVEFLKCARCQFHNERSAKCCEICQLTFTTKSRRPCWRPQQLLEQRKDYPKEHEEVEESATPTASDNGNTRSSDKQDGALWTELQSFLGPYYSALEASAEIRQQSQQFGPSSDEYKCPFCPLPEKDLYHQLEQFVSLVASMKSSNELYKISLQYKVVLILPSQTRRRQAVTNQRAKDLAATRAWNAIASRGFACNSYVGFREPIWTATTLQGGWNMAKMEEIKKPETKIPTATAPMPPIFEFDHAGNHTGGNDEELTATPWAWIVAVAESTLDTASTIEAPELLSSSLGERRRQLDAGAASGLGTITHFVLPEQVLPLICFDPKTHATSDEIRILMNGLSRAFQNFQSSLAIPKHNNRFTTKAASTQPSAFQAMRKERDEARQQAEHHLTRLRKAEKHQKRTTASNETHPSSFDERQEHSFRNKACSNGDSSSPLACEAPLEWGIANPLWWAVWLLPLGIQVMLAYFGKHYGA